jgi:hypothetical protein
VVGLLVRVLLVSLGVTCPVGWSGWVAGWLSFVFVFFNSFGVEFFVLFFQERFGLFRSSFHRNQLFLSPLVGVSADLNYRGVS